MDQAGLLGTVFESINEALVLMDTVGVVRLHNAAAVQILGREKLITEPRRWLRRMPERPSFTYSFNPDGSEDGLRMLAVQLAPVQYAGSESVVAIVRDVTTEQRRIEELASFAAVAAHDLKSPLAAVQGWMEVAEDALEGDAGAGRRGPGARTARDRPDVARDRGLADLQRRSRRRRTARADRRSSPYLDALAADYPDADFVIDTPDTVMVDPTLLRHLFVNLIDNAVKYTQPGERPSIAIRSFSESRATADLGRASYVVVDAGIGIPEGEETADLRAVPPRLHRAGATRARAWDSRCASASSAGTAG